MMRLAPIALFVFKRPEETRLTLEHLVRNPLFEHSELFVFCDAARRLDERAGVEATRQVVQGQKWGPRVHVSLQEINRGLANSIIAGTTELCRTHGRAIVLEDDLLLARDTLQYLNTALDRYADQPQVMQVSAQTFPAPGLGPPRTAYFAPFMTSWGWATWDRAWQNFDPHANGWEELKFNPKLRHAFDAEGSMPYSDMLISQMEARIDSWAVRWRWSMFRNSGLALYPTQTLVRNVGFSDAATHTTRSGVWQEEDDWTETNRVEHFPDDIAIDEAKWRCLTTHLRRMNHPGVTRRILAKLRLIWRRVLPRDRCNHTSVS